MPTKPEQADLEHVLYTSQGDSLRTVLAPGTVAECYEQTRRAFRLAYDYQLPAIVLYDQKVGGEMTNVPASVFDREPNPDLGSTLTEAELADAPHEPSGKFKRFRYDAENGVKPRAIPGQKGGRFMTTGNEHNEAGHISEDPVNRVTQVDNRMRKLDAIREDLSAEAEPYDTRYGPEDPDHGILTFGSQQGTVEEAVDRLNEAGHSVAVLSVSELAPYPAERVSAFLDGVEEALVVEMNASGQFRGLTQKELGRYGDRLSSLLKYNGEPFMPGEIVEGFETSIGGDTEVPGTSTKFVPATGD
jgi:pyruvate ferredoxin oxidoreductase alpha subunit